MIESIFNYRIARFFILALFIPLALNAQSLSAVGISRISRIQTDWVTSGGGILAFGSSTKVYFADEDSPYKIVSSLNLENSVAGCAESGKTIYLLEVNGIRIFDLSEISNPVEDGFVSIPGAGEDIAVGGDNLYVQTGSGVAVLDISTPLMPLIKGYLSLDGRVNGITAGNGLLLIKVDGKGIFELRGSEILNPYAINVVAGNNYFPLAVTGELFLASSEKGIFAINLYDGSMQQVSDLNVKVKEISPAGRMLYISSGENGFYKTIFTSEKVATFTVDIGSGGSFSFSPANLTVAEGDTVEWEWKSGTHSTTSGNNCTADGIWNSGTRSSGTFSHTFNNSGDFSYFCIPHCPMGMTGKITVTGAPAFTATADGAPTSGTSPLDVTFSGSASGGTGPYTYDWDFGDGSPNSSDQNPVHSYLSDGSYNVVLTVTDSTLATALDNHLIINVGIVPPVINGVSKAGNPFRIKISGSNFHSDVEVYIGSDTAKWGNVAYKSSSLLVLKKGSTLKAKFPKGVPVQIRVENGDGGEVIIAYTR